MIEINLIPDVKQELIKAQKVRSFVVFISVVTGIAAAAITVLLSIYVFGAQFVRNQLADDAIKTESSKLSSVDGLDKALTIQNQLTKLSDLHMNKKIDSRLFSMLTAIIPPVPNDVTISRTSVSADTQTITIDAQANNGFPALEVFRKTIEATKFEYIGTDDKPVQVNLADELTDSDRSYGQDASGHRVLRFTIAFKYPKELFARDSSRGASKSQAAFEAKIIAPTKTNVTDSFLGVPDSLFTTKATDTTEGSK
jgi:hypothetical protein